MAYLIAILVALVLFIGFIGLTALEKRRGTRFFADARASLDAHTSKVAGVARSADPLDFVIRGGRVIAGHIFHDIANVAWALVRMLERTLSTVVRRLRTMRQTPQTPRPASKFEESMNRADVVQTPEDTVG